MCQLLWGTGGYESLKFRRALKIAYFLVCLEQVRDVNPVEVLFASNYRANYVKLVKDVLSLHQKLGARTFFRSGFIELAGGFAALCNLKLVVEILQVLLEALDLDRLLSAVLCCCLCIFSNCLEVFLELLELFRFDLDF